MSVRLNVGDVVLVYICNDDTSKQGIGLIKYIGSIRSASCDILKQYCGIELIEPIDNGHDGTIDGYQYFSCKKSYGIHTTITNVIKKLKCSEIMKKLQEVIEMFKKKLSQYIHALNNRDNYIKELQITQKKLKSLLNATNALNLNAMTMTTTSQTPSTNNSANTSPYFGAIQPTSAALVPISDMGQSTQSLDQMLNKGKYIINVSFYKYSGY